MLGSLTAMMAGTLWAHSLALNVVYGEARLNASGNGRCFYQSPQSGRESLRDNDENTAWASGMSVWCFLCQAGRSWLWSQDSQGTTLDAACRPSRSINRMRRYGLVRLVSLCPWPWRVCRWKTGSLPTKSAGHGSWTTI